MADQEVKVVVTVDANQAQTALKQTASAAEETAKSTAKVGEAAKTAQPKIGDFGSSLGLAGQAIGQLVPGLGQVVSVAGSATGVIQGLTTAGLGPLGMAIGVVSVAVTAGVKLWQDYKDKTNEVERDIASRVIPTLSDLASKIKAVREEQELTARVRQGGGTELEQAANYAQAQAIYAQAVAVRGQAENRLAEFRRNAGLQEGQTLGQFQQGSARLRELEQEFQRTVEIEETKKRYRDQAEQWMNNARLNEEARARAAQETAAATAAQPPQPPQPPARTGGGGGARRAEARYSYDGSGDARRDIERENRWIEKEEQESNARQLEDLNNFLSESADIANYYREREREEEEKQKEALAEIQRKAEDERLEAAKRTKELILETSMESLDTVLSAFDEAATANLEAMLTGGKMTAKATREMVKETMLALTTESIVQGLKQTALGLGALAMGSPSAALHFASAAKFAAVGVAAGVAGAAAGGFKGVGQESDTAAPAAATGGPALSSGATGAMASTVVINWGSSGLVYAADRAQLGRDISGMISEAHGRLGRGA
jgi:hypothetical protein